MDSRDRRASGGSAPRHPVRETQTGMGETERLLHLILHYVDDLIAVVDLEGKRLYNSPSYEQILGERNRLRGTDSFVEVHPDDRMRVKQVFLETVRTGIGRRIEYRLVGKDGRVRDIESQGNMIRDEKGNPDKVVVVSRDITERKRSERTLLEAEAKFRNLVQQSLVGVYLIQDDRFVHVNPKFAEIFGYTPEEIMVSLNFRDLVAESDRSGVAEIVRKRMEGKMHSAHHTFKGRRKDGNLIDVEVFGTRTDYEGRPAVIGTLLDITERKQAEEERARLTQAVEQTPESIMITSVDGTIRYVNPAFERITGYSKAEVIGQNPRILKSGIHDSAFYAGMWETLLRGEVWSGQVSNRRKNGSIYLEEMVIAPVRDAAGSIVNYVAAKRDVTHEIELEQHLRQAQKMESLGQLAGGIAHDFNNILNIVEGAFTLLKPHVTEESLRKFIALGEDAVRRGTEVARRLITFARTERSQLLPLSLAQVIRELSEALEKSLEKTITLTTGIDPDLPLVQGDHAQLFQSLLTLCINARDAIVALPGGAQRGSILIGAKVLDQSQVRARFPEASAAAYVRITVTDTGIGMTGEVRDRIFEPFFTTKPDQRGSGMGLAVIYGVVKAHRGFIDVATQQGKGTTFSIYLPVIPAETHTAPAGGTRGTMGGSETILVVEDEEGLRLLLGEALKSKGYAVLFADDGLKGLELYRQHQREIHAVITDMGLPKQSGHEMLVKIRELDPEARVILVSGYLDPSLKSKLLMAGAKAFIQKPFKPEEVLSTLREILDLRI